MNNPKFNNKFLFSHTQAFRENASDLVQKLFPLVDAQKLLEYLFVGLKASTKEDIEVSLFIIASVGKKIDRCEDKVMPDIVNFILNINESTSSEILMISVKLLGEIGNWISAFHHTYLVWTLNFLSKFLELKNTLSSAAIAALGQICTACSKKMEPHMKVLFNIYKSLKNLSVHSRSEIIFIRGITDAVCNTEEPLRTELLTYLCELQIQKMYEAQNQETDLIGSLDQLAEIYENVRFPVTFNGHNPFASIFIEHWTTLSKMLCIYESNRAIMKKITECIECAIRNLRLSVLPVLDQMVKQLIYHYAVKNYEFLLRLLNVIADKLGGVDEFKDGFLITFQGITIVTFNALHDENVLNTPVIDEYFRLASTSVQNMANQILKSPLMIPIIDLAIELCQIYSKTANRSVLKFLYTIFGNTEVDHDVKHCVKQAMVIFGEAVVKVLLESSIFVFDASLITDVVDIFDAMKSKSSKGFEELFQKALQTMRKRNNVGNVTVKESQINCLRDCIRR